MFEIVVSFLGQLIDMIPYLIAVDLIFYYIGKLIFGSDVR